MKTKARNHKDLRVLLMANSWVGLQITHFLRNENVVGLFLHEQDKQKRADEITKASGLLQKSIYTASFLRTPEGVKTIRDLRPDIIVCAFWGYILKPDILSIPPLGCVNFHPGLLPFNRGMNPNVWPFLEGTPAGVTLHYVDDGIDTGDIIAQKQIVITPTDTAGTLEKKTWIEIVKLFKKTWPLLRKGTNARKKQTGKYTFHWAKQIEDVDRIDLDKRYRARDLIQLIRARSYPKRAFAYYEEDGKKVYVRVELTHK